MVKVSSKFKKFLKEKNFRLTEGKLFGRVHIYSSEDLIIRLVKDYNSFKSVEIANIRVPDKWIDLSVIRSYILSNNDHFHALDFEVAQGFIIEHYDKLLSLLNAANYDLTLTKLHELKVRRSEFRGW